ncbi:hypothetical protein, partial [Colwellia psychrerythraea]
AEKSIKINGVPVGTYQVVVAAINRLNSRVFQVRTITFTKESATILDEAGWEEIPESGADVTDYEGIANDIANATNNLGKSNFASEVTALLEQVENISTEKTLPVFLDGLVEDINATDLALSSVRLDETKVANLHNTYQQLGLDVLTAQGDTNSAFTAMLEKVADTDQFVFDINEQLGLLLVEGGKVSYDQFVKYQLLVDTVNASLTSMINQVSNGDTGLSAAHSKIQQNIDAITLLTGNNDVTDAFSKITQVSIDLNRLSNAITKQAIALKGDEWGQLQQTLNTELQLSQLAESNVDFAFAQEEMSSNIDEAKAEASNNKILMAAFKESLSLLSTTEYVLSSLKLAKAEVTKTLQAEIADEKNTRSSQILEIQQVITTESETHATAIEDINSTINDAETGLAKAHSEIASTNQTVSDESETRATAIEGINSTINDAETGLAKAHSEIASTNQTVSDESETRATAIEGINSTISDPETGLAKAHSEITATNQTVASKASTSALTNLAARVSAEENKSAAAILTMNAQADDIGKLEAKVFLGVDANGKITGMFINGSSSQSLIDFMGDKIQFTNPITNNVDFRWSAAQQSFAFQGSINLIGATHMRLSSANAFGSSNQFIEWFGPRLLNGSGDPDFTKIKESNAISFLKSNGEAYFGGAIVSGTLSNSLATSSMSTTAIVDLGTFGSNGGSIAIACSVTLSSSYDYFSASAPSAPANPACSIRLEEYVGSSWVLRQNVSYIGTGSVVGAEYEREFNKWRATKVQSLGGSFTYTDNKKNTANRRYRLRMTSRSGLLTSSSYSPSQRLSITTSEG